MELEDDVVIEFNLILVYESFKKLCERLEVNKELCLVGLVIN